MAWAPTYPRRIAARRPDGFEPRAPRWSAFFDEPLVSITCDYIAVQIERSDHAVVAELLELVEASTATAPYAPGAFEIMHRSARDDLHEVVFVGYWTDPTTHDRWRDSSPISRWFRDLDATAIDFGAWRELITSPIERLETVYSSPDREFGFAACEGIALGSITNNGYFGAARDRIPQSAIDPFDAPREYTMREVDSRGRRLRAELGMNVCAIRSGQYWETATGEQLADYEEKLEPHLLRGMDHLVSNQQETGTLSLRILRNGTGSEERPLRETSVLAYFRSLEDLETWASGHPTHHVIHRHAIEKNRQYGAERTVTTWHEVFVLDHASQFEYVNCDPETGVLAYAARLWTDD